MPEDQFRRGAFPTTRISLIMAARGEPGPDAREALSLLCQAYWYPIYAYVRRLGHAQEDAEDLTQGFFTRVLEKHSLRDFDRERGRFRSYLLGALKHFVANARDWDRAVKRGGAVAVLPLDADLGTAEQRYRLEPRTDLTPEKIFERAWAVTESVLKSLGWEIDKHDRAVGWILTNSRGVDFKDFGVYGDGTRHKLRLTLKAVGEGKTVVSVERELYKEERILWMREKRPLKAPDQSVETATLNAIEKSL